MRHTNDNGNPRWYHYVAFVVILLVAGYALQACASLLTPTARAASPGVNVKATAPQPGWRPIFADWWHVEAVSSKAALSALPGVLAVEDDPVAVAFDDPRQAEQYQLTRIQAPRVWATSTGAGVVIAILDTGVNCAHEDLRGHCTGDADDHGHGTHVAGIAAATAGNGLGGAGVAPSASILSIKVLDSRGSGSFSTIAAGLTRAADVGAGVANMSLGCVGSAQCDSQMMREAVAYAQGRGTVVVAAAGNHGSDAPSYPAVYALSVAATDQADRLASFSAYGDWVDVSAPGVGILSTYRDGTYGQMSGTSMASPVVAGVAALVKAACPSCSVSQVEDRLRDGDPVDTTRLVGRRVNAYVAVNRGAPPSPTRTPLPPLPTVTPRPPSTGDGDLVQLINAERDKQGLAPYALDARLTRIAHEHNQAMNACAADEGWTTACFGHVVPGEPDVCARFASVGVPCGGEVIGQGYVDAAAMVAGWMGSSGHRAILLDARFTAIGCAADDFSGSWEGKLYTCDTAILGAAPPPVPTVAPTPRPPAPPAEYSMVVVLPFRGAAWADTDWLYYNLCASPVWRVKGLYCRWVKTSDLPPYLRR